MVPTFTTQIPETVTAGDSIAWRFSDPLHSPVDGWAPSLTLLNAAARITAAGATEGEQHTLSVAAATTATWAAGRYRLSIALTRGAERVTVWSQDLQVLPDPATAAPYDTRSHVRRTLEALEAWIEGHDMGVASYRIGERQMQNVPIGELLQLRDRYRAELRREAMAAKGRGFTKIQVRF